MFIIGGSPGSTAGGVKTTTIVVLILIVIANLRNRGDDNGDHKGFDDCLKIYYYIINVLWPHRKHVVCIVLPGKKEVCRRKAAPGADHDRIGAVYEIIFNHRNGADEVIYPERDIAERLAVRVSANHVFDYIEMGDYGIYEIPPRDEWLGKSIKDVNFRVKYNVSIIGTKENGETNLLPPADHVFKKEEHLMIIGKKDVDALLKNMK